MPAVDWATVRKFSIGSIERPATKQRKSPVFGRWAIRVPKGGGNSQVFAPCAYFAPGSHPPLDYSTRNRGRNIARLYEDSEGERLLCFVDEAVESNGERHHQVRDGQGEVIGTLRRVPPTKRLLRHTWRIDQPGHPEIAGRHEWASTEDAKEFAALAAEKVVIGFLDSLANIGGEGGDQPSKGRPLIWKADDELVMTSEASKNIRIRADWLDRRLAFAFAMLGDR
ncbi:hypothetical protein [Streptomyces sp. XD-27]|uniref:hypothetical protein n=1 Tax=Streptomyces sp. XD-27 TaxID=3062779 RepID=UPI0026F41374|nr:hypothetical protein [Streptomyces sp. XD-27]WKX70971.1 hypothetical protein Q3Y56_14585 [Streptomyces sp. XD-27]